MADHWTYEEKFDPDDDLEQGDILLPNDALSKLFDEVHPHFCNPKYVGFIVLTQSCDLVRRKGSCSARYLNLGVIRQLDGVLTSLLDATCRSVAKGIYVAESKHEAKKLLARVFNQNEQGLGLFYLHPDADVGIGKPSIALLRVAVAFRHEHYDVIRGARCGRLSPEFRNKLGWLVGNIFSRIGTPDWSDRDDASVIDDLSTSLLKENGIWLAEVAIEAAKTAGVNLTDIPREKVVSIIEEHSPLPPREQALDCIKDVMSDVLSEVVPGYEDREQLVNTFVNRLRNDSRFAAALKLAKRWTN